MSQELTEANEALKKQICDLECQHIKDLDVKGEMSGKIELLKMDLCNMDAEIVGLRH